MRFAQAQRHGRRPAFEQLVYFFQADVVPMNSRVSGCFGLANTVKVSPFHDAAAFHNRDAGADFPDDRHLMRDEDDGDAERFVQAFSSARICLVVCGSSAEVASSHSRMRGSLARRAHGHALLLSAESCAGYALALSSISTSRSSFWLFPASARGIGRFPKRERDVFDDGAGGHQIEMLEDHPDFPPRGAQFAGGHLHQVPPVDADDARIGRSSRLMQRTSVDLPAPEKPMMP